MDTIDTLLWLVAGAIFTGGAVVGALVVLGWFLLTRRRRDTGWRVRSGN